MAEGARRKKTKTVELDHKPDGTEHGGGRVESADERRRTDERTKRTEADDVEPARTDEDSGRWKQTAVVTTEDE